MRVLGLTVTAAMVLIAAVLAASFSWDVTAQDNSDERLSRLESTVDTLPSRITELETRVAALEGTGADSPSDAGVTAPEGPGDISLTGAGDTATELIALEGVYALEATCQEGFVFTIDGVNVDDPNEFVIIPLVGQPPFTGSTVMTFDGGRYAFSVSCGDDWKLDLTTLS